MWITSDIASNDVDGIQFTDISNHRNSIAQTPDLALSICSDSKAYDQEDRKRSQSKSHSAAAALYRSASTRNLSTVQPQQQGAASPFASGPYALPTTVTHKMSSDNGRVSKVLSMVLFSMEALMIVLFIWKGEYGENAVGRNSTETGMGVASKDNSVFMITPPKAPPVPELYPMFQDVHVMIFVGFGFLMTFLQKYGFGSLGFNFLIASYVIQWAMIVRGIVQSADGGRVAITVDMPALITADFVSGAVLISFGAVLGKTTATQLIAMATIEVCLFCVNEWIGVNNFKAADIGGSIFVHSFGAYFGLAVARVLNRPAQYDNPKEGSVYHSDLFSMIGTVFLWMYWPSFNSIVAPGDSQYRAIYNTYLSIAASSITAFALSPLVNKGKISMVHIQNATLAGGVAVGSVADMMIQPWGALVIGSIAGVVSVGGYQFLTPMLASKLGLHDTCGVNNLHGMPGLMAATGSIIAAGVASKSSYDYSLCIVFPERCKNGNVNVENRSAGTQALMQAAALGVTLSIAIVGGIVTGFIMKYLDPPVGDELFDDETFWEMPEEGAPTIHGVINPEYQVDVGDHHNLGEHVNGHAVVVQPGGMAVDPVKSMSQMSRPNT